MGTLLSKVGVDGIAHILICQNMTIWLSKIIPTWLAVIITVVLFVTKELYDKYCKNTYISTKDLACDCGGVIVGILTLFL